MRPDIQEGARLHEAIAKRPTPSSRLATDLRDAAIAFARRRAANGATQMTIAHDLGVTTMTVSRRRGQRRGRAKGRGGGVERMEDARGRGDLRVRGVGVWRELVEAGEHAVGDLELSLDGFSLAEHALELAGEMPREQRRQVAGSTVTTSARAGAASATRCSRTVVRRCS